METKNTPTKKQITPKKQTPSKKSQTPKKTTPKRKSASKLTRRKKRSTPKTLKEKIINKQDIEPEEEPKEFRISDYMELKSCNKSKFNKCKICFSNSDVQLCDFCSSCNNSSNLTYLEHALWKEKEDWREEHILFKKVKACLTWELDPQMDGLTFFTYCMKVLQEKEIKQDIKDMGELFQARWETYYKSQLSDKIFRACSRHFEKEVERCIIWLNWSSSDSKSAMSSLDRFDCYNKIPKLD